MRRARPSRLLVLCLGVGLGVAVGAACFERAPLAGYFRCESDEECGGEDGILCFDGVCCRPKGQPLCLGYVFDDGSCADGGLAQTYYPDLDEDGFGDTAGARPFCAPPASARFVTTGGDCNDNPEAGGALAYPGRSGDPCDGVDNDCDGEFDEDTARSTFYFDADGDGRGDLAAPRLSCAAPSGYVTNSDDCAPDDPVRFPGAVELCNGVSDDCDAQVDEDIPGTGDACQADALGVCAQGAQGCVSGVWSCVAGTPKRDVCDGLDNNCNGTADEAPDCGGPPNLLTASGVTWKAQNLNYIESGGTVVDRCLKNHTGYSAETFASNSWQGSGTSAHLLYVETTSPWDLTKPGTRLRLKFSYAQPVGANSPHWIAFAQPLVYLCGATVSDHIRFVHKNAGDVNNGSLLSGPSGSVDTLIPVVGGPDGATGSWLQGSGSALDLSQVRRVEVLIVPSAGANPPSTTQPTFNITLQSFGFETAP